MAKYILALDEGTTSTRAILFDRAGQVVSVGQKEFTQYFPHAGWVEHDAEEIYTSERESIRIAMEKAGASPADILAAGITNQRETVVLWDKRTGKPLAPAIVWQCRRTAPLCEKVEADGYAPMIAKKTGLKLDAYFSATKIAWLLENVPHARELAESGNVLAGTMDTWLLWKFSGGKYHRTDETNASRTMLYNLATRTWDEDLLRLFHIPANLLPEILPSGSHFGEIEIDGGKIPVCAIAGDQQAAMFGQKCFSVGTAKNTYGTGCFLLVNCGEAIPRSQNGLLTTALAVLAGEKPQYGLEGSIFIGGSVVQWLRDGLGFIAKSAESEALAASVPDTDGVILVPAFTGLGAPYWNMNARGMIVGLTRGTTKAHITRAALESIAYQSEDILQAAQKDAGITLTSLRVDGGASRNNLLMQMQADYSNTTILRPSDVEATARGVAFLAGLVCGLWANRDALPADDALTTFTPKMSPEQRKITLDAWHAAVGKV